MNKQFIISAIALTLLTKALGFVVHGILLESEYAAMPNIMRTQEETEALSHYMISSPLLLCIFLTWVYRMGHDPAKSWAGQGVRFGLAIAMVAVIPMFLIYYVVQQTPASLAHQQMIYETISMVIVGMAAALLNR